MVLCLWNAQADLASSPQTPFVFLDSMPGNARPTSIRPDLLNRAPLSCALTQPTFASLILSTLLSKPSLANTSNFVTIIIGCSPASCGHPDAYSRDVSKIDTALRPSALDH